nr:Peptidase C48, SUMO/Sentrin/Ubl1 [Ipomoea batatas]
MAAADDSSPDLQRVVNRRAGNRLRLDEIRSKQIVVVKRSRKRSRSDVGDAGPSNAPASSVLAVRQTAAIIEMGFASLFHLQIDNLPTRMGYWLVENYNPIPRNSTLYLADGTRVSITKEDVQLVLGFPRGDLKIEKWFRAHNTDLLPRYIACSERFDLLYI